MGGRIWLESSPGSGSCFYLELPFTTLVNSENDTIKKVTIESMQMDKKLKILIAEDNLLNLQTAELILKKLGHETVSVRNGQEAVERWHPEEIDLVLMDIQMPVMGGVAALQKIREKERPTGGHVPIIALTADALKGVEEHLRAEGFDGYLTKPIKLEEMREILIQAADK